MGWWTIPETNNVIGDRPLDLLGEAVSSVVQEYTSALGRRPTKAEWEAMLSAIFTNDDAQLAATDDGSITLVRVS